MTPVTRRAGCAFVVALACCAGAETSVLAQTPTVGVIHHDEESASEGYTLVSPFASDTTYLIDNWGRVIHKWLFTGVPHKHSYLLEDGSLLKLLNTEAPSAIWASGRASTVRRNSWEGRRLWNYTYVTDSVRVHHDIEPLPNGNVLLIAWEAKYLDDIIAAGMDTSLVQSDTLWPDHIVEVQPTGRDTGEIVWEWHMWDHLVQDFDSTKDNYGVVAEHPELINANELLGGQMDWAHLNSVDYNPILDQIVLSSPRFNELWFIDHSTTTAEAAGHVGGARGMGGDLIYRWGNSSVYDRPSTQTMYFHHDGQWIPPGHPGAGNILLFSNRNRTATGERYSSIGEFVPAMNSDGSYTIPANPVPFGPSDYAWTYESDPVTAFYGPSMSGTQRLPNGNTLICNSIEGTMFEVTPDGVEVWRYVNPATTDGIVSQGDPVAHAGAFFKCNRYSPDYPAFSGRDMTPGYPIEPGTARHVVLQNPANGSESQGTMPTFVWEQAEYASSYRLQVARPVDFAGAPYVMDTPVLDVTTKDTSFTPSSELPEGFLYWRVQSSNEYGPGGWSETKWFSTSALPVGVSEAELPTRLWLAAPYPNPFNPTTRVRFGVAEHSDAQLTLYDVLGRRVMDVYSGPVYVDQPVEVRIDASGLTSGTYVVRLEAGGKHLARTVLVAK